VRTGVCDRRDRRRRNTSHWRVRERYGHQRSPQVQRRRRSPFRPGHERTTPREAARVGVFPPRLPRALRALFHEAAGRGGRASSFRRAGAIATRFEHRRSTGRATACHKQRARAVSSGQSRSLREGRWAGRPSLTWCGGGARNCMACKGSGPSSLSFRAAFEPSTTRDPGEDPCRRRETC